MFHAECEWFTMKFASCGLFQFLSKDKFNYADYLLGLQFTIFFRILARLGLNVEDRILEQTNIEVASIPLVNVLSFLLMICLYGCQS